jgi:pSer/pThr/pTyr-binding forkhead associated (FHA) protein
VEALVLDGPDKGRSFALSAQSVIGRDPTATVHLTDDEVSRRHAIITIGEGQATIEDLGSVNGTQIDDGPIRGEAAIRVGDRIRVGRTTLELRALTGSEDPEALRPTKTSMPTI